MPIVRLRKDRKCFQHSWGIADANFRFILLKIKIDLILCLSYFDGFAIHYGERVFSDNYTCLKFALK